MIPRGERRFLVMNQVALISLFILILAGGIVRGTGSGMGCPDWPKCFDRYVPPTSSTQLPADYEDRYVARRVAKNERFAATLDLLGYGRMAAEIRNDPSIHQPEPFNAAKTWTEYINRLIGALTGFFLIGCAVFSSTYLGSRSRIFWLSLLNLFLVGFQGWLGSIVVSTNLLAWVVTVHMILAMVIVAISVYTYFAAKPREGSTIHPTGLSLRMLALATVILTLGQIVTGTEVREQVDAIARTMGALNRSEWVSQVGYTFNLHRDLSIAVAGLSLLLGYLVVRKFKTDYPARQKAAYAVIGLIVLQMLVGVCLAYTGLPGFAQVLHVTFATLLFAAQFYLLLLLSPQPVKR